MLPKEVMVLATADRLGDEKMIQPKVTRIKVGIMPIFLRFVVFLSRFSMQRHRPW